MKTKRKIINILVTLSFLMTMLLPMATPAFAASDNFAVSVPKVENDTDNVVAGTLTIREDADSDGFFAVNDVITVNLPAGVEFHTNPTVATVAQYVTTSDAALTVAFVAGAENYISFRVSAVDAVPADEDRIFVHFGDLAGSVIDLNSEVTGDVQVEIDAAGTAITSEFVTIARVVGGETTTTISKVETLPIDGQNTIGNIKISENAAGVLDQTKSNIQLVLPNDFDWVVTDANADGFVDQVTSVGVTVTAAFPLADADTLVIDVTGDSAGQAGFISITGAVISTSDEVSDGDEVEMTIKGNEVSEQDIVVAKVGEQGFKISLDGDVNTIVAGKNDEDISTIVIDDKVNGTWDNGDGVTLTLPDWAEWNDVDQDDPLDFRGGTAASAVNTDRDELKFTSDGSNGKAELENMTVNIDADAPAGDLVVKFKGSAGVEGELVIAKIVAPFTITTTEPEVVVGVQNQKLGEITITESEDGAIDEDKWIVLEAPNGMTFADTPEIEVTEGDIEIEDEGVNDEYFAFRIDGESGKQASTIKISDITFTVDRTIPVGDIVFDAYMLDSAQDLNNDGDTTDPGESTAVDNANDVDNFDEELEEVTSVVVGNVITSAPTEVSNVAEFVIGQTTFKLNGVEKTMDVAPYLKSDRTYLPLRYVANAAGVADDNIMWNDAEQSVVLIKGDRVVKLVIGSNVMLINGVAFTMDVAPELVDPGRTMLPIRWVAQALGCQVLWDDATQTVTVK